MTEAGLVQEVAWPVWVMMAFVLALVVSRFAESSDTIVKLLGPVGRWLRKVYTRRRMRTDEEFRSELKRLARELMPELEPPDYLVVKGQLANVMERVLDLEIQNAAYRAYIVEDEEWHFQAHLLVARLGDGECELPPRLGWSEFLNKWKTGWRPA